MSGTEPQGGGSGKGDPTRAHRPGAGRTPPQQEGLPKIPGITLHHEIARGGMGVVYAGRQDFLDRRVAVKFLSVELGGAAFAQRFQREAKILAGIKHPNIVACHTADTTEEGQSYLVMEFIDGPSLKAYVAENGPVAPLSSLRLVRAVANALGHAHQSDVIHRDVKPENILLETVTSTAIDVAFPFTPKLVDLGLARMTREQVGMGLTSPGSVMGTPSTMSPEQFDDPDSVDFRSDIYGLGCVLYEMLVGHPAFRGNKLTEIVLRKRAPVPPNPCDERAGLPAAIGALVQRMLASAREDRPASYKQLDEEIGQMMAALVDRGARTDTIVAVQPDNEGATIVSVRPGTPPPAKPTPTEQPTIASRSTPQVASKGQDGPAGLLRTAELDFLSEQVGSAPPSAGPAFREGTQTSVSGGATGAAAAVAPPSPGRWRVAAIAGGALVAIGAAIYFAVGGAPNAAPVVTAIDGPAGPVKLGSEFSLRAIANDPDGDELEYEWAFPDTIVATSSTSRPEVTFRLDDGLPGVEFAVEARVSDRAHSKSPSTSTRRIVVGDCPSADPTVGLKLSSSPWRLDDTGPLVWTQMSLPDGSDSFVSCKTRGRLRSCATDLGDEPYWDWTGSLVSMEDGDDYATLGVHLEFGDRAYGVRCSRADDGAVWRVEVVQCIGKDGAWQCQPLPEPNFVEWRQPEDTNDEHRAWFSLQRRGSELVMQVGKTRLPAPTADVPDPRELPPETQPPFVLPLPTDGSHGKLTLIVDKGIGRFRIQRR